MKITTSFSTGRTAENAFSAAYTGLVEKTGNPPDLLMIHCTANCDKAALRVFLDSIPDNTAISGSTSCLGVMSENGYHSVDNTAVGMFGITDKDGDYGTGISPVSGNPRKAAVDALNIALVNAGRPGEVPVMVLISCSPGCEESVIAGIESVIGPGVPVFGGSSADNNISGEWFQFTKDAVLTDAAAVSVLFPSAELFFGFHSGYKPAESEGTVTGAIGRILKEIDNRPAAIVYNEWSDNLIADLLGKGGDVFARTNFFPLGIEVGRIGEIPYYKLSHPEKVNEDNSLSLFTDISAGDRIVFMKGTEQSLIQRPASVLRALIESNEIDKSEIEGVLLFFCAGSMMGVRARMNEVVDLFNAEISGRPFLGTFTFGEQGTFAGGENRHGNLMISSIIFTNKPL